MPIFSFRSLSGPGAWIGSPTICCGWKRLPRMKSSAMPPGREGTGCMPGSIADNCSSIGCSKRVST